MQYIETVLSLSENSKENSCSKENKATEQETSIEGLILKELPSHLKYAFLELEKAKPVITLAALTENEEQKILTIIRKQLLDQLKISKVSVLLFACTKFY